MTMNKWESKVVRVATPDGVMFVSFIEDSPGRPNRIQIFIGKAGSNLNSWTDSVAHLVTCMLQAGSSLTDVLVELSGITSDRIRANGPVNIRSGPEGLVWAMLRYQREIQKIEELKDRKSRFLAMLNARRVS